MDLEDARRLQKLVDSALAAAFEQRDTLHEGGVNWGDLRCTDVESRRSLLNPTTPAGVYVIIEEALPGAHKLCRFVEEYLRLHGFAHVSVETEW